MSPPGEEIVDLLDCRKNINTYFPSHSGRYMIFIVSQ